MVCDGRTVGTAVLTGVAACAVGLGLSRWVNTHVPPPHMDELFHIPQTQVWCRGGAWSDWDPKITTLPGLYLIAVALHAAGLLDCDNPLALRAIPLAAAVANIFLTAAIVRHSSGRSRQPASHASAALARGAALAACPMHVFFALLYYTDVVSVTSVLAMWAAALHGRHVAAAALGLVSLLMRQNNVVWILFCGGVAVVEAAAADNPDAHASRSMGVSRALAVVLDVARNPRKIAAAVAAPYLAAAAAFAAFIVWNDGSVVVGDKAAHTPVLHWANGAYALAAAAALGAAEYELAAGLPTLRAAAAAPLRAVALAAAAAAATAAAVRYGTLAHPYVLADNSHLPFYLWKNVLSKGETTRLCLVPLYVCGAAVVAGLFARARRPLWALLWMAATLGATVPAHLIEPRYFFIPIVILRTVPWATATDPPGSLGLAVARDIAISAVMFRLFITGVNGVHIMW